MKEGTDYTTSWSNASSMNAGTYAVTITGKGTYKIKVKVTAAGDANYNGLTKTATFKIKVK